MDHLQIVNQTMANVIAIAAIFAAGGADTHAVYGEHRRYEIRTRSRFLEVP